MQPLIEMFVIVVIATVVSLLMWHHHWRSLWIPMWHTLLPCGKLFWKLAVNMLMQLAVWSAVIVFEQSRPVSLILSPEL